MFTIAYTKTSNMKNYKVIIKVKNSAKSEMVQATSEIKAMFATMDKYNCGASAILEIIEQ